MIPLLLTVGFGVLTLAMYRRIGHKAKYLQRLEAWMAAAGLGWEATFKRRVPVLGALHWVVWIGPMAFDLAVAVLIMVVPAPKC